MDRRGGWGDAQGGDECEGARTRGGARARESWRRSATIGVDAVVESGER